MNGQEISKHTWENDQFVYTQILDQSGLILEVIRAPKKPQGVASLGQELQGEESNVSSHAEAE